MARRTSRRTSGGAATAEEEREEGLRIARRPLSDLVADPANARTHDERNLQAITDSLRRFGQAEPLVVQAGTGRVIGGNGRLEAMRQLGWTECDVVELAVDDLNATSLAIALNRTAELADWDDAVLACLLEELREADALGGVGFDDSEIDRLVAEVAGSAEREVDDPGPTETPVEPVAQLGDVWVLGDHRLLCGDSTKLEDVQRVMGDDRAALVATDPPYLVDYTGKRHNTRSAGKDWTATYKETEITDADAFFRMVFTNALAVMAPRAAIYCWHAHPRTGVIQAIWEELGIVDHQQIVWVKRAPVFGRVYWHFQHETCVMGWRKGSQPEHDGNHEHTSVWQVDWDGKSRVVGNDHPTEKPVELFARPMRKHTRPGDVVFEPFSGSGSQLIAAEREGRRCRAIEISPAYVDVAITRWEQATGRKAVLEGTDRTFEAVAAHGR